MKVRFLKPISLNNVDYKKGEHVVPDELQHDWYLKASIEEGHAIMVEGPTKKIAKPKIEWPQKHKPSLQQMAALKGLTPEQVKTVTVKTEGKTPKTEITQTT